MSFDRCFHLPGWHGLEAWQINTSTGSTNTNDDDDLIGQFTGFMIAVVNSGRVIREVNKKDQTKRRASFRAYPMSDTIADQLRVIKVHQEELQQMQPNDYKNTEGYIFTRLNGVLVDVGYPSQHFKRVIKKIGLPIIRFHDLRHSSGTYLTYLGFTVQEIQNWLGQSDIKTTLSYLHFDMDGKRTMLNKIDNRLKAAK